MKHVFPNLGGGCDWIFRKLCWSSVLESTEPYKGSWAETDFSATPFSHFNRAALLLWITKKDSTEMLTPLVRGSVGLGLSLSFLWILPSERGKQFPGVRKTLFHSTKVYRGAKWRSGCEDRGHRGRGSLICRALCPWREQSAKQRVSSQLPQLSSQEPGLTGDVAVNLFWVCSVSPDTSAVLPDREPRTVTQNWKLEKEEKEDGLVGLQAVLLVLKLWTWLWQRKIIS